MPLRILKQSGFTYKTLTDCINNALVRGMYLQILRQFAKKMKLLIKKIIGQWVHYPYFYKSLKKLFMINLVNIWKITK